MTIDWAKLSLEGGGPRYRRLAQAIGREVEARRLGPGEQLPTHRALAAELGVSIGTVTRAYAEAERLGLVTGEVGRGTFVRGQAADAGGTEVWGAVRSEGGRVDLGLALPWTLPGDEEGRLLGSTLADIATERGLTELLLYRPESALGRHREEAARWLDRSGVPASADRVAVTAGAQHGISVVLSMLLRPGDEVLAEALTYPGMIAVARSQGHPLRAVELDREGMVPAALERAARESGARAVYVVPDAQNPTGGTLSEGRRRALVTVARALDLLIIEDAVHRPMMPEPPPPFAALAPERTIHLVTFSKAVAFGLRTGFVVAPEAMIEPVKAGIRTTVWNAAPLMTELTLRWLADGTAAELTRRKCVEMEARHAILREVLGGYGRLRHDANVAHAWLELSEAWRADELVERARRDGVILTAGSTFMAGRGTPPQAVRICVGVPRDRDTLRGAVEKVGALLAGAPPITTIV